MNEMERYRECSRDIEGYRNRLIDQHLGSAMKTMDLGSDRLLKDCEIFITLFGLLVAGLSFLYNNIPDGTIKIIFIVDLILIFMGIIRSFYLRQRISRDIEIYHKNKAEILGNEINELDFDPPRDPKELYAKWLKESKRLLSIRENRIEKEKIEYKKREKGHFREKMIISGIYAISFLVFLYIVCVL